MVSRIENPFLFIVPRKEDKIYGRKEFLEKVKKTVLDSLNDQVIVTINGEYGIGKTLFIERVVEGLKKRKSIKVFYFDFNLNTLNDLRNLPTEKELKKQIVVVIDRFELILSLSDILQKKILEMMVELCEAKITFIIATTDDLLKKIKSIEPRIKRYFKVLDVPKMSFEEAKELIVSRLNEIRPRKSDSLEPFTLKEVKHIYKVAKGNPRMILLLCASLLEEKI